LAPLDTKPLIGKSKLQSILNKSGFSAAFVPLEDPIFTPFVEEVTFFGGSFLVLPGIDKEITFRLRHLLDSIFSHGQPFPSEEFPRRASFLASAVLAVSDTVIRGAGLKRGTPTQSNAGKPITIPSRAEIQRLARAVRLEDAELERLLGRFGAAVHDLNALTIRAGNLDLASYDPETGPITQKPFAMCRDSLIVSAPSQLSSALVEATIRLAFEHGVQDEVARRYHGSVCRSVLESLRLMRNYPHRAPHFRGPDFSCAKLGFFNLDVDGVLCSIVLSDSLHGFGSGDPNKRWPLPLISSLREYVASLERQIRALPNHPRRILFLIIFQPLGARVGFAAEFPEISPDSACSMLTACELDTISEFEARDPLALWKFATAADGARRKKKILTFSALDEYNLYKQHGHSYYVSDGHLDLVHVQPDSGTALRQELAHKRDYHAARWDDGDRFVQIRAIYDASIPIYAPSHGFGLGVRFLVEQLPAPVWIIASKENPDQGFVPAEIQIQIGEAIAYWLWQASNSIRDHMQSLGSVKLPISIRINWLGGRADWSRPSVERPDLSRNFCETSADPENRVLTLALAPNLATNLLSPDNSCERMLLTEVLRGLRRLLPAKEQGLWTEAQLHGAVEKHAPLGIKKKVFALDYGKNPELCPLAGPTFRSVQDADKQGILDEIGDFLRDRGWKGRITGIERTEILNSAVEFCFKKMVELVSGLSPEGLLEFLVAHHEALTRAEADHRLQMPTRMACFAGLGPMVSKFGEDQNSYNEAGIAGRFVLEYVASRPPSGDQRIGLGVYDRLQALAASIFDLGSASDLVHLKLTDPHISILDSGRLGYGAKEFEQARTAFLSVLSGNEFTQAVAHFTAHWMKPEAIALDEHDSLMRTVNSASVQEMGVSLEDLVAVMFAATMIGIRAKQPYVHLAEDKLVDELCEGLGWDRSRTARALLPLSMEPRADFMHPKSPFTPQDVKPWIFNRGLSYLRRPFLILETVHGREIVFGPRHMAVANRNLQNLIFTGRFRAQSPEMRQMMGEIVKRTGEKFNDRVADFLETIPDLVVRRRVRKVGKLRVSPGDIDVLIASPKTHILRLVECKDLAVCRTPREFKNQVDSLFEEEEGFLRKHIRREQWAKNHLEELLQFLKLSGHGKWRVTSIVVLSQPLLAAYLGNTPMSVVTFEQFQKMKLA